MERPPSPGESASSRELRLRLIELDLHFFADLGRDLREGMALVTEAGRSLEETLEDSRVEEHELLRTRHATLKAMACLRRLAPQHGSQREHLLRVLAAIRAFADCFVEVELHSGLVGPGSPPMLGEFSRERFEEQLARLLEAAGEALRQAPERELEMFTSLPPMLGERPLLRVARCLELLDQKALPGCVYGLKSSRDNPFGAALMLRDLADDLQEQLQGRQRILGPLERLAKLEGKLTSFIEEVRAAGEPIEDSSGWLSRLRPSRLQQVRALRQEYQEIEALLRPAQIPDGGA